ncbi:MAG: GtrA family protein [Bacteroidetes bacterium]|nr:MAG: GtrA family protein [Bacteroidota bacterium]RLD46333.1 MAG: GtrA family protein [Bacteroidota bacterium]RLD84274.1 MAG: GtrA family protein [Bacteroidota bacterium]
MDDFFSKAFFLKFLKFGLVGFTGVFVDFGITYLTKEKLHIPKYVANAIGFTTAASTNYYLNRIWTFESTNPEIAREYTEFLAISLIGLGINTLILWLLVSRFKMNFYLAKVFAIAVVTVWNFLANAYFTFYTGV